MNTEKTLESSKISLRKWLVTVYLEITSLKGLASMILHRDLRLTRTTAWLMLPWIKGAGRHDFRGDDPVGQIMSIVTGMFARQLMCPPPITDNRLPSGTYAQ